KRAAEREAKVSAGLDDLAVWLGDLVRQGLAQVSGQTRPFEEQARRLVDAQAPAAARRLQKLAGAVVSGEGWPERLLERLGQLALLVEAWRRIETLPEAQQEDVRAAIGFPQSQEEVRAGAGVRDLWRVGGQR